MPYFPKRKRAWPPHRTFLALFAPSGGLCTACRNSTSNQQQKRSLQRRLRSTSLQLVRGSPCRSPPGPMSRPAGRACFLKNLLQHGNMVTFFSSDFEISGFFTIVLFWKITTKNRDFKGPPFDFPRKAATLDTRYAKGKSPENRCFSWKNSKGGL